MTSLIPARGFAARLFFTAALLLSASTRHAVAADASAVPEKAEICVACHGPGGNSDNPEVPSIAEQTRNFLVVELYQYRVGRRKSDPMTPVTEDLTDGDLALLAGYFSAQKAVPTSYKSDPAKVVAGKQLTEQNHCVQCHGPALTGQEHVPRLVGLPVEYLRQQLRQFKTASRADIDGLMTSAAQVLSDADIDNIADYLAGLQRP